MQFLKLGFRRPQRLFVLTYVLFKHTHIKKKYIYIYIYAYKYMYVRHVWVWQARGCMKHFLKCLSDALRFCLLFEPKPHVSYIVCFSFRFVFCIVFCNSYVGNSFHPCAQYRKKCLPIICRDRYIIFIYM